jgi:hypothetical protein
MAAMTDPAASQPVTQVTTTSTARAAVIRALRARRKDGGVFSAHGRTITVDEQFAGELGELLEAGDVRVLRVENLGDFGVALHFPEGAESRAEKVFDDWLAGA